MEALKKLTVTIMFIYIFVFIIYNQNFIAAIFLILLAYKSNNIEINLKKDFKLNLKKQRKNFINILSHELRIPTIAQIRALELVNKGIFGEISNSQKEIFNQMELSCKCLLNLMSLLINIYSMENDEYKFIQEKFNISDIIISCFNDLLPFAKEKNITFEYNNKNNENTDIIADREELKKVIYNILSASVTNAVLGEKISVITMSCGHSIRITVKASNHVISRIETPYTSVGNNIRIEFCKKVIDYHHGKIMNNKNSFTFELPLQTT